MSIWEIIFIGIGLSMDAAAVSLCNGLMETKMVLKKTLFIALLFGFFQGIMPIFGYYLGSLFNQYVQNMTLYLASSILILLGVKMIYEQWLHKDDSCSLSTIPVLISQGFATSIDAFLVGFSLVFLNVKIYEASFTIAIVTALICFFAILLGKKFGNLLRSKAVLFGGLILIGIGIKIIVEGLI
ncbi:MAG: manganese efflux pump [Bacilli bacterium]|nr:manganese efflux pump [Bacilli bacterium]